MDLDQLMRTQRAYFLSGATRSYEFRTQQLRRLRALIKEHEDQILAALDQDIGKPGFEAYTSEVGFMYEEIDYTLSSLASWMKPKRVRTPLILMPSSSQIIPEPMGQVLIIGPWNYPLQLVLSPLVGAIAAGNVAVLKPSELAPATSRLLAEIIPKAFSPEYITVVEGAVEVSQALLARHWDYIFFTGSTTVGRIVARAAAEHLTPVTLELGGKSPCIVHRETDLDVTARRIAWGKFFNAGQTCVAPDYLLVDETIKAPLLERLKNQIHAFFGDDPARSPDYARIINERHFDRLTGLLVEGEGQVVAGGRSDRAARYMAPTIIDGVRLEHRVMADEIFGPILPVLSFRTLDEAIATVRERPNPLALYLFTSNEQVQERIMTELPFGGGCINNTVMHLASPYLPFGGRGASGTGAYHGKYTFDTFTHHKSVVKSSFLFDPSVRYQPYKEKLRLVRRLVK